LSVIVCTYNRCRSVETLINAFERCERAENLDWELLIVDNNSRDATRQTIETIQKTNKTIRYAVETKQGLSHARNRGIEKSHGNYLFFMDDDAVPDRHFLTDVCKVIKDLPQVQIIGTKVISYFPDKPKWFATSGPYALRGILGIYDLGIHYRKLTPKDPTPIGSGLLIKKSWFEEWGGFDTRLGVKGNARITGRDEDTDLMINAMASGTILYYSPIPLVHHYPDLSRYDIGKLRLMFFGSGYFGKSFDKAGMKKILGVERYLLKRAVLYYLKSIATFFCANIQASVYYKTRFWADLGKLTGQVFEQNEKGIQFTEKIFNKIGPWVL
ncbi:MAG: glycosyltransferase, partial [Proteobacteria bacterium]|nr:glycosyltransferase [Pseudomonadota bacterium]